MEVVFEVVEVFDEVVIDDVDVFVVLLDVEVGARLHSGGSFGQVPTPEESKPSGQSQAQSSHAIVPVGVAPFWQSICPSAGSALVPMLHAPYDSHRAPPQFSMQLQV